MIDHDVNDWWWCQWLIMVLMIDHAVNDWSWC